MSDDEKVKYVLELDVPGEPDGAGIEIPGLGVFANGGTHEITEAQASDFRHRTATSQTIEDKDTNVILGSEIVHGKTVLQASRSMMSGITVSTYHEDDDQEDEETPVPDEGQQLVETPAQTLTEDDDDLDEEVDD
jgi:hypothetical protein